MLDPTTAPRQPQPHAPSYYAATVHSPTDFPSLSEDLKVDVCVVGGGFTGTAAALRLAEKGHSVALLEAERIGWGASGRNGGQLIQGMSGSETFAAQLGADGARFIRETRYLGNRIVEDHVAKHGIACDLKRGWMTVACRPSHMRGLEAEADELAAEGHPVEVLDRAGLRGVLDTDRYHGAFVDMQSGHVHPLNLVIGEAHAAAGCGVRIFEATPVTNIEHGQPARVQTARGTVTADWVLLTGGAYHRLEAKRLRGLVFPTGSYIIATEPLGDRAREINPRDLAICDSNVVLDYYRLSADGRMLYGGRCNYSNREPRDIAGSIRPRMVSIFPQLADARIDYAWGGHIGIVLNRVPAIGRLAPNVAYAQGYSGHGVNFSHVAAEILAEAVSGTMGRFDLFERIRHMRVPASQWIGNQILALGMTYYRLRDLI